MFSQTRSKFSETAVTFRKTIRFWKKEHVSKTTEKRWLPQN